MMCRDAEGLGEINKILDHNITLFYSFDLFFIIIIFFLEKSSWRLYFRLRNHNATVLTLISSGTNIRYDNICA